MLLRFLAIWLVVQVSTDHVDKDHFCLRINAGDHAHLNFQAFSFYPSVSTFFVVESGRLYESTNVTPKSVNLNLLSRDIDWLEHFAEKQNLLKKALAALAAVNRSTVKWVHSVNFGNDSKQAVILLQEMNKKAHYLVYVSEDGKPTVTQVLLTTEQEHRIFGDFVLIQSHHLVKLFKLDQIAKTALEYVESFRKGTLLEPIQNLTKFLWLEGSESSAEVHLIEGNPEKGKQLLVSVPYVFSTGKSHYFLDPVKAMVYYIEPAETDRSMFKKVVTSYGDFFHCPRVNLLRNHSVKVITPEFTSAKSPFDTLFVAIILASVMVGLLIGAFLTWLALRRSPPSKQQNPDSPTPTQANDESSKKTTPTRVIGDPLDGRFLFLEHYCLPSSPTKTRRTTRSRQKSTKNSRQITEKRRKLKVKQKKLALGSEGFSIEKDVKRSPNVGHYPFESIDVCGKK